MVEPPEENNTQRKPEIDGSGWLFLMVAVVIMVVAAIITYEANDVMLAPPVSHLAAR